MLPIQSKSDFVPYVKLLEDILNEYHYEEIKQEF